MATLDQNAIAATGATTMGELLQRIKPLTQSADGSDPIFLLNGQRTSGYEEIGSLPPEALDKVEVLPKRPRFDSAIRRRGACSTSSRSGISARSRPARIGIDHTPGSTSADAELNLTRLHNDQR